MNVRPAISPSNSHFSSCELNDIVRDQIRMQAACRQPDPQDLVQGKRLAGLSARSHYHAQWPVAVARRNETHALGGLGEFVPLGLHGRRRLDFDPDRCDENLLLDTVNGGAR